MDRAWKSTIERERPFTVDSVVDFNDEPELMVGGLPCDVILT